MKALTRLLALSAFAVIFGVIVATDAIAQKPETSFLRLGQQTDVGGTVLEPGVYVITVLPDIQNRNILQVTNEDRSKVFATVLSIPHGTGQKVQTNTEYVFYPATEGSPQALRTWFAPRSASEGGHDIVYPARRAMQLAAAVKEPVVAYKDETKTEDLKTVELVVVTPAKEVIAYVAPTPAPTPAPKPVVIAEARELPRTASHVPLFAMLGLLLLSAAVGIRAFRVL
jgi:hypothetical protein